MISSAAREALQSALGESVEFDALLARRISLCVGGPADALAAPPDLEALGAALRVCSEHALPVTLLGSGFNTLVLDGGVDGVVIQLKSLRGLAQSAPDRVRAEAGASHNSLIKFCVRHALSGLEFGAGIPGTIGGWVAMNAGIGEREVKDALVSAEVMRPDGSGVDLIEREALDFRYRALANLEPGAVLVAATFAVDASTREVVQAEVDRMLAKRAGTQPLDVPSCGSVFENPPGDFAGRLVEAAGLKGARKGGAQISPLHANFIANTGGATAEDILALIERARETVRADAGVELQTEVKIVGRKT